MSFRLLIKPPQYLKTNEITEFAFAYGTVPTAVYTTLEQDKDTRKK